MRISAAVFAGVAVLAAGLFWYENQQTQPPVAVVAQKPDAPQAVSPQTAITTSSTLEPVKPAPAPVADKSAEPQAVAQQPAPLPAPVEVTPAPKVADSEQTFTTLAPPPIDPNNPEDVMMVSRPAFVLRGQSSWDDGYPQLAGSFARLAGEAKALDIKVTGRAVAVFVETDDRGFRYEAVLPVAALPAQKPANWPSEMRLGATPEGKAIRFVHKGPYDEIDSTYEAITAYLDVKGIEAKETLIEEYINLGQESGDAAIEAYIYVQPNK
ncbi:MAG: GyrI-like domain-containing protein [Beijerinckiaceae bacterium]